MLPPTNDTSPEVPVEEGELNVSLKYFVREVAVFLSIEVNKFDDTSTSPCDHERTSESSRGAGQ